MIDTLWQEEMVCPYCGYENEDSWEYDKDGSGERECYECGKKFKFTVDFSVTYSTFK